MILAAGLGTRINMDNIPKGLIKINGISIIHNNIDNIRKIFDINKIIIITNDKYINIYKKSLNSIKNCFFVINKHLDRKNGYSLFMAKDVVSSNAFIMIMSDHYFSPEFISSTINFNGLAVDSMPIYVDMDDATKVLTDNNGIIIDIGKNIKDFRYIDTGYFILNKNIFEKISELEKNKHEFSISDIMKISYVNSINVTQKLWVDVDTKNDLTYLRNLLQK